MNQVRRDRYAEELARIRDIVSRQQMPEFVTGFDVQLGDFHGDPAVWIVFQRSGGDELGIEELKQRAKLMNALYATVESDLLAEDDSRVPYFRSEKVYATK